MVRWLGEITARDTALVGGKGANLGECVRVGLPVPPGFCVTTDAYRLATATIRDALAEDASVGDAERARARVLAVPMPEQVAAAVEDAYLRLGGSPVAVRSSATAEDLPDASFAGQQDTYLGVTGVDAVVDAVRRCWSSLWTNRAVDYRRQQGIGHHHLALAVVVQQLVNSDTAGVLFTHDPVTGDQATMLVNASYGLGESVVAGLVTPDAFALSRTTPAVLTRDVGSKLTRIDRAPDGGTATSAVAPADQTRLCVADDQLLRLLALGNRVEAHYGTGQDLEWAFAGPELFLLQARPITTNAAPVEGHAPVRGRVERALQGDLIEHFPAPYPLDLFAVHKVQDVIQDLMGSAGFLAVPATALVQGDADGIVRITITEPRPTPAALARIPQLLTRGLRQDPSDWPSVETALRDALDQLRTRAQRLPTQDDEAALTVVRDSVDAAAQLTSDRFLHYLAPMIINRSVASALIRLSRPGDHTTPEDLYAGVPYKTATITAAIKELARHAQALGLANVIAAAPPGRTGPSIAAHPAGRTFLNGVETFLVDHGARTARMYLPFSSRSWREDPEALFSLVAATLRGDPTPLPPSGDTARRIEQRLPSFLRPRWRTNTAHLQARHVGREGTLYYIEEFFCVARTAMTDIAYRLVDRQQLDDPDDLRFLYLHEVEDALGSDRPLLQALVGKRRRKRPTAEALWFDRGTAADDTDVLRGLPASPGQAIGAARVIRSPEEFHRLQPGDVLVCPYTDPTWTPLFALAAAVVADSGGPLSHAAIVAREYGIPAVLGTGRATTLPDGVTLLVDGTAGAVSLHTPRS